MKKIFYLAAIILAFTACDDDDDVKFPKDKYVYDIPDVPVTEDYAVGAFYDELGGKYWTEKGPHSYTGNPVLGEYDLKKNPEILKAQLDYAAKAKIDFFVISWNGHGSDTLLWNYESSYRSGHPKLVIKYDCQHFDGRRDSIHKDPAKAKFLNETDSLFRILFTKDFYYKAGGEPVMVMSGYKPKTRSIVESVKDMRGTRKIYVIGEIDHGWTSPELYSDTIKAFDGLYESIMATPDYDRNLYFYSFVDYNYKYWQEKLTAQSKDFIPVVHPAYYNRGYDPTSKVYELKREKEVYQTFANVGKRNIGRHRMIIINSWNNYRDGSGLEPTEEFKETYLDMTREFFKK